MKVAIVAFNNIRFSPYILTYSELLKEKGIETHLIYPNRANKEEEFAGVKYAVRWNPQKKKIYNFLYFAKQAKRILKREKYDFVFVLTTFPAVLLSGFLSGRYKGRYLVDIRDYTYEGNKLFFALEKKVLKNAACTVISSPGFVNFLPKGEYCLCHNLPEKYARGNIPFEKSGEKIVIGYVGTIAYAENCRKLIDLVARDERFAFHLYGNENSKQQPIKRYVEDLNNDRIQYFGEYAAAEKDGILQRVDLLFNIYGNDRTLVKYALSNKLYDSFYYKKPLLVSPNTSMQEESDGYSYAVDFEKEKSLDGVYEWYFSLDAAAFEGYAQAYLATAFENNKRFKEKINKLLERNEK